VGASMGVMAALLAQRGFTGAPAITMEADGVAELWSDLGTRWRIREQYFKPHAVCRWAQPAIEAALSLSRAHSFPAADIASATIESFAEAVALGSRCPDPATSDEAQYSLRWSVAAALVFGAVDPGALAAVNDPRVARLSQAIRVSEDRTFSERFPAQRFARVRVRLRDGRELKSDDAVARGNEENPLRDDEIRAKFFAYAVPVLGRPRADRIAAAIDALDRGGSVDALIDDLLSPVGPAR